MHGKNFNGYYWKNLISFLTANGYRVIVPDQVGWGRSGKPNIHYSFHLLAANTKQLLDSLHVSQTHVIGHSMGGMLAARFALMYPQDVNKLIFEDPIGLEDYKTFVPYQPVEKQFEKELKASYESYKKYQQGYYPAWKPEYEQYVAAQAEALSKPDFEQTAWANALTYQMIYEQPVVYEFKNINLPDSNYNEPQSHGYFAFSMKQVSGLQENEQIVASANIYFDYNKATLRSESTEELEKLAAFLLENSNIKVELSAHTDSRGSAKDNKSLSQKRAQSSVD